jgi:hypothetical protein
MKKLITRYAFNTANKTVLFSEYSKIYLGNILLITNITDNIIIYNFADATKGGTVSGNTLTLTYNTAAMDGGDTLQIYYDDPAGDTGTFGEMGRVASLVTDRDVLQVMGEVLTEIRGIKEILLTGR